MKEAILANFKKFTAADGRTVWLNVEQIVLAEPFNQQGQDGYVRVSMTGGVQISLRDDIRFIVEQD
jgi:hypothetical protein